MPRIYEVTVATSDGDETLAVKTLKEARAFVKENDIGGPYRIDRIEIDKLDIQLLLDVINSRGGCYASSRETIETRGEAE